MAIANVQTSTGAVGSPASSNKVALAVVTTLFFMWGSLTSLNDVLIPYAQNVFKLRLAASMLIQTAFFSAYFIFSIPSARVIDWIGYKKDHHRWPIHDGCFVRLRFTRPQRSHRFHSS